MSDPLTESLRAQTDRIRSAQIIARAIIDARHSSMSAPAIRSLASTIRGAVGDLTKLAGQAAAELAQEVDGFKADVADVQAVATDIRTARAEVRAALGAGTNGGPAFDDPTPSAQSEPSPTPSGAPAMTMERTAIGFVTRRVEV